jgi:chromosome partitioning protein
VQENVENFTMSKIISFIQVKGGAGKSTIATNIAGMVSTNKRVALIDCDMPQATSASWASVREGNITTVTANNHSELVNLVTELEDHDLIIIDTPPRIAEITKASIVLSDLCLVPLGASAPEIWSTADLLETIEEAREVRADIDTRIIWTRFRAVTNVANELSTEATKQLKLKALKSKIGFRVAYSEAIGRGLTVLEWRDRKAKDELINLGKELQRILKLQFMRGIS